MKNTLKAGERFEFAYTVPREKTVPFLYREAPEFQKMPEVLATGFMVGLMEWTCVKLLDSFLDEGEGSLGTHVNFSHLAATPPGHTVTVTAICTDVDDNRISFHVSAHDGDDLIGEGDHQRHVVSWDRFEAGVAKKVQRRELARANG